MFFVKLNLISYKKKNFNQGIFFTTGSGSGKKIVWLHNAESVHLHCFKLTNIHTVLYI